MQDPTRREQVIAGLRGSPAVRGAPIPAQAVTGFLAAIHATLPEDTPDLPTATVRIAASKLLRDGVDEDGLRMVAAFLREQLAVAL